MLHLLMHTYTVYTLYVHTYIHTCIHTYIHTYIHAYMYVHTCIWEKPTFCKFHQNSLFAIIGIYNVWVTTSLLSMSIYHLYNCTVSELQRFVTQPLILPILRVVKLCMCLLTIKNYSRIFADPWHVMINYCSFKAMKHTNEIPNFDHENAP